MDTSKTIKKKVQERYGGIAISLGSAPAGQSRPCSCAPNLYSAEEIAALPEDATNLALGCGNPTAIADLKPGQVVLDLGSGGGIDCFLAAKKVGPKGKVYGLDMTIAMIDQARKNAAKLGAKNVEFMLGEIEKIPLPDAFVDVIISNCVINLSPEKEKVFAEAFRVLKPGGQFCVSDMVLLDKMPDAIKLDPNSWSSCVSGALPKEEYLAKLKAVGFTGLEVKQSNFVDENVSWLTSLYVKGKKTK